MTSSLRVLETAQVATEPAVEARAAYELLRRAYAAEPYPSAEFRRDRLRRLEQMIVRHQQDIIEAIDADFTGRSRHETLLADIFTTVETTRHALKHVERWMKPRSVAPQWYLRPATARVEWQPLGVVAVIAPWNYPVNTALAPVAAALAAGNRVLLKPSEMTPRTAELLSRLVRETFAADEFAVVTGGPEVAKAVVALPFDHVLFTGSTRVGREVAKAAAGNLTPVTLELGGKSPALIHPDYSIDQAADRVAAGKLFNAGQTCIAPDYVLLKRGREQAFIEAFRSIVGQRYPELASNGDYSAMATVSGFERMNALLADATAKGARVETICPGPLPGEGSRKIAPALIPSAGDHLRVMQEEIFGPILPMIAYDTLDEALAYINARPRPLAFYYFDTNTARCRDVLRRTVSGGACINDTLLHFAQDELPFGGVGESGLGRYHGLDGFETFSHKKGIFVAGPVNPTHKLHAPPYTKVLERSLQWLMGGKRK